MINGPGEKIVRDPRLTSNPTNHPSCICQRGQNCAISRAHFETRKCYVTPGFGVSGGVLSFMSTCRARACLQGWGVRGVLSFMSTWRARTCYITPGFGVSGGVLSFMSTCRTRTCDVTPGSMQCDGQNRPFHVVLRPESIVKWIKS